ncbi:hypothetical protein MMC19_001404 [Ptychographa xylographoides]|nr:hypothetical protein [Ptychographa xylographoides]
MIPAVYNKYADKGDFYSHGVMGESAPIFQTRKQEDHAPKRKIIARSLSLRNLPAIEERIDERLDLMRTIMIEKFAISGLEFDFPEWIRMNLYDMVTQLTFSDLIGFVKHGQDVDGFIAGIYSMSWFAGLIATLPWLMNPLIHNNLTKRFFLPRSGDKSGTGQVMKYQDKMVEEHLSRPDHGPDRDILHNLLQTRTPDGSSLPIEDVKAETMIFLFTASVTLSAIVCPFINYVCSNPQVLATLSAEIDSFESKKEISSPIASYRESSRMPYLMACIEETLRLAPPTPVALTRKIGTGGTMLNGVFIPEGVEIGANPYVINRDPGLFGADAHLFRPERWLQDASCTRHMSKHIFTWGFGVRDCAGKAMARLMLQKLCLQLVRDFTFALSGSGRGRAHSTDRGLCFYRDQWVSIRMRERP